MSNDTTRPRRADAVARSEMMKIRERRNLSQREIAAEGEVTRSTIARVEAREDAGLSLPVFIGFCRGMGEKAWKILRDVEEEVYGDE